MTQVGIQRGPERYSQPDQFLISRHQPAVRAFLEKQKIIFIEVSCVCRSRRSAKQILALHSTVIPLKLKLPFV